MDDGPRDITVYYRSGAVDTLRNLPAELALELELMDEETPEITCVTSEPSSRGDVDASGEWPV